MQVVLTIMTISIAAVYLGRLFYGQWTRVKSKCGECGKGDAKS